MLYNVIQYIYIFETMEFDYKRKTATWWQFLLCKGIEVFNATDDVYIWLGKL